MLPISSDVASYLRGVDVAYLQGADTTTRALICESGVWSMITEREMPCFVVGDSLLKDRALQPLIVKCFGFLSLAILSAKCVVKVSSASDLQTLEAKLRSAARVKKAHIGSGGRAAHILVGEFGFTFDSPSPRFRFRSYKSLPLCGLRAGELFLKVCIEAGKVKLGAEYRELHRRGNVATQQLNRQFTANISSVNSAANLSLRGACLSTDGMLKQLPMGSCNYAFTPRSQEPCCLSSLCIATLMDGTPENATPLMANALSMDASGNLYPRAPLSHRGDI